MTNPRIIVALDYSDPRKALALASQLSPDLCRLKVGSELYTQAGPQLLGQLQNLGYSVFLDLKFHDIPNTVARACRVATELGVWMLNIHAMGGRRVMEAARLAVDQAGVSRRPLLLAVTVLTSMTDSDLAELGVMGGAAGQVMRLAALAADSGLDGVVCSGREVVSLRETYPGLVLVTPGIRSANAQEDDQRRTMTASQARAAGADYLVVGRPVTLSDNPLQSLLTINSEISYIS